MCVCVCVYLCVCVGVGVGVWVCGCMKCVVRVCRGVCGCVGVYTICMHMNTGYYVDYNFVRKYYTLWTMSIIMII